jgi:hypothetical protein
MSMQCTLVVSFKKMLKIQIFFIEGNRQACIIFKWVESLDMGVSVGVGVGVGMPKGGSGARGALCQL